MFYEWRSYEAVPGKMPALTKHLEVAHGLFDKHGLGTVGFWTDEIGTTSIISYIWIYEDLEVRQRRLTAFATDPAWREQTAAEAATEGPIVANVSSTLMQPTPYSPEPKIAGKIQELRVYDAMPGKLPALHNRFADHTLALFKRHKMESIGYWTETFGHSNRLVYMLGYESVGAREEAWASFGRDPEWVAARTESEKDGPLTARATNRILRPTRFSPRG